MHCKIVTGSIRLLYFNAASSASSSAIFNYVFKCAFFLYKTVLGFLTCRAVLSLAHALELSTNYSDIFEMEKFNKDIVVLSLREMRFVRF